jgi:hypothetical protein
LFLKYNYFCTEFGRDTKKMWCIICADISDVASHLKKKGMLSDGQHAKRMTT